MSSLQCCCKEREAISDEDTDVAVATAAQKVLLYHRLMLPNWLRKNAEWSCDFEGSDLRLIIKEDSASWENILKVQLMPADVLKASADITVNIVIGVNDSDPEYNPVSFMVTDRDFAMGFQLMSERGPVTAIEGEPGRTLRNPNVNVATSSNASQKNSPGEVYLSFQPSSSWSKASDLSGSCSVAQYSDFLDVSKGLSLELYRYKNTDKYTINYIEVTVYEDSPQIQ